MQKLLGGKILNYDELITIMAEIEGMVDSRSLTYLSEELSTDFMIRPIDFLSPNVMSSYFPDRESENE